MTLTEQSAGEIREAAYYRWLQAGGQPGEGVEYWLAAEREYIENHPPDCPKPDVVQVASEDSFPASDPPAWTGATASACHSCTPSRSEAAEPTQGAANAEADRRRSGRIRSSGRKAAGPRA